MSEPNVRDKAVAWSLYDTLCDDTQLSELERITAAYRAEIEKAERERALAAIEAHVWAVAADAQYKDCADGIRVMLQAVHDVIAKLRQP